MQLKKQAIDLTDLAIGIIVLGVVVSIGAVILVNMRDTRLSSLATSTQTNESLTFTTSSSDTLSYLGSGSVTVTNVSTGATVHPNNYTVSVATDGTITVNNLTSTLQPWYATYTKYDLTRADYTLPNTAAIGLGEYGNWFKIIVIVGVAAVVLSLIFMAFGRNSGSSGGFGGSGSSSSGQGY